MFVIESRMKLWKRSTFRETTYVPYEFARTICSLYIVYWQRKRCDKNDDNVKNIRNQQLFSLRARYRETRQRPPRYSTSMAKRLWRVFETYNNMCPCIHKVSDLERVVWKVVERLLYSVGKFDVLTYDSSSQQLLNKFG